MVRFCVLGNLWDTQNIRDQTPPPPTYLHTKDSHQQTRKHFQWKDIYDLDFISIYINWIFKHNNISQFDPGSYISFLKRAREYLQ